MRFTPLAIPDVLLCEPEVHEDPRGYFMETWREDSFAEAGIRARFVQDNQSGSNRHTLRGLHYQVRQPQGKLVRVVQGEVLDVVVDLREGSPTFGRWLSQRIDAHSKALLWVPPGFAHGFVVLSGTADFVYRCTDYYAPDHERTLAWDDPELAIDWQLPGSADPTISDKDQAGTSLADIEPVPRSEWDA